MPAALPIQSTPVESDSRQFKSADGKPARAVKARHWPFESSVRTFRDRGHGVGRKTVCSGVRCEAAIFELTQPVAQGSRPHGAIATLMNGVNAILSESVRPSVRPRAYGAALVAQNRQPLALSADPQFAFAA